MGPTNSAGQGHRGLREFTYDVLIVAVVVVFFLFLWQIADAILFAFIGVLLAVMWRGLAGLVNRILPIGIGWNLIVVAVLTFGLIFLFFWFAGPRIGEQLAQLIQTLPGTLQKLRQDLTKYSWSRFLIEEASPSKLGVSPGGGFLSEVTGLASSVFVTAVDVVVVLVTALYLAVSPGWYVKGLLALVPKAQAGRVEEVFRASARTLRYWLLGQGIEMLIVGSLTTVGLWIAHVPLAFVLGVIAGVLDFVPFLGPIAAAFPGLLIALGVGPMTSLYALIVYVVVHQLENHVITPLVQKEVVLMPPALVVLAIVAFGLLFGILGVLVATPLTAVALVWIKAFYVRDTLGKPVDAA